MLFRSCMRNKLIKRDVNILLCIFYKKIKENYLGFIGASHSYPRLTFHDSSLAIWLNSKARPSGFSVCFHLHMQTINACKESFRSHSFLCSLTFLICVCWWVFLSSLTPKGPTVPCLFCSDTMELDHMPLLLNKLRFCYLINSKN